MNCAAGMMMPYPMPMYPPQPQVRYKRKRMSTYDRKALKAGRTALRLRKRYPRREYGRAYFKRGDVGTQNLFGADLANASPEQLALREVTGYRGKGDYRKYLKYIPRGLGAAVGAIKGGTFDHAKAGWDVGAGVSKFVGWGDYKSNQIMGGGEPVLKVGGTPQSGDIVISDTEMLRNVVVRGTGRSEFQNIKIPLNPGLSFFPRLSQYASVNTLYEFQQLIFEYRPLSGTGAGSSNALGKVVLVVDYDPTADGFTSTVEAENYSWAASGSPNETVRCGVECDPDHIQGGGVKYIRTGKTQKSLGDCDYGILQVISENIPIDGTTEQDVVIGELYVSYRVRLSRPSAQNSLGGNAIKMDHHVGWSTGSEPFGNTLATITSGVPESAVYDIPTQPNIPCAKKTNTLGGSWSADGDNITYTFPVGIVQGTYCITWSLGSSILGTISWTPPVLSRCTLVSDGYVTANGGVSYGPTTGQDSRTAGLKLYVNINSPGLSQATVTMSCGGFQSVVGGKWLAEVTQVCTDCVEA